MKISNKQLQNIYDKVSIVDTKRFIKWHHVLGDEIRHNLFHEIIHNPGIRGKELLSLVNISQPTLSFHMRLLIEAELVVDKRDGQSHTYYPNIKMMLSYDKTIRDVHKRIIARIDSTFDTMSEFIAQIEKE